MSGILSGINYSLLYSSNSSLNASSNILSILYSSSSTTSGPTNFVSTGNPLLDLKLAQANQTADVKQESEQPQVSQAITAFTKAINSATNIKDALANPAVQQVLLTANGLSNYIGETSLVQQAFLSNPNDPNSLVNKLGDSTLLSTVQTYNFATTGLAELKNPSVISTLTNAYAEVEWRQSLDAATPGLSNALTFLSQANQIKSVNDILTNLTNFQVVTTALGIPQQIVNQDLTAQQQAVGSRINIANFQNPNYVTSLTDAYLLTLQQQNSSNSDDTRLTSLANSATTAGIVA
jgi:Protein of unknown function (DUF1217)